MAAGVAHKRSANRRLHGLHDRYGRIVSTYDHGSRG
jgi:hypothetical protein